MYKAKYSKRPKKRMSRLFLLLASLVLLVNVSIFTTMAFLTTSTGNVENTFIAKEVPNEVVEEFDHNVKKNVKIRNTGDVDAYIRAAVVFTWVDKDGNVSGVKPVEVTDYTIEWKTDTGWVKGTDGYYYYTNVVPAGQTTGVLFTGCQPVAGKAPEGYQLSVEIMGQSIQADGKNSNGTAPVADKWPVTVNTDGSLTIQ